MNSLIPFVSTHFILTNTDGYYSGDLTLGRVYRIEKWMSKEYISFADDVGDTRNWVVDIHVLKDASFEYNLQEILK